MTIPTAINPASARAVQSGALTIQQSAGRAAPKPQLRRYEVMSLIGNGQIAETRHVAPALPLFEDAFCAFSRGSMVETETGPVAVEDLLPGDRILTRDGSAQPLVWKGRTTVVPGRPGAQGRCLNLTRILADSFGLQRPMSCMIAGPAARLLQTPDSLRAVAGGQPILTPVDSFIDGLSVFETTPPSAVDLFHLCLPRHCVIRINGLEFESYHPGLTAPRLISHAMRDVFLNLFPHVGQFCDFGPLAHGRAGDGPQDAITG